MTLTVRKTTSGSITRSLARFGISAGLLVVLYRAATELTPAAWQQHQYEERAAAVTGEIQSGDFPSAQDLLQQYRAAEALPDTDLITLTNKLSSAQRTSRLADQKKIQQQERDAYGRRFNDFLAQTKLDEAAALLASEPMTTLYSTKELNDLRSQLTDLSEANVFSRLRRAVPSEKSDAATEYLSRYPNGENRRAAIETLLIANFSSAADALAKADFDAAYRSLVNLNLSCEQYRVDRISLPPSLQLEGIVQRAEHYLQPPQQKTQDTASVPQQQESPSSTDALPRSDLPEPPLSSSKSASPQNAPYAALLGHSVNVRAALPSRMVSEAYARERDRNFGVVAKGTLVDMHGDHAVIRFDGVDAKWSRDWLFAKRDWTQGKNVGLYQLSEVVQLRGINWAAGSTIEDPAVSNVSNVGNAAQVPAQKQVAQRQSPRPVRSFTMSEKTFFELEIERLRENIKYYR